MGRQRSGRYPLAIALPTGKEAAGTHGRPAPARAGSACKAQWQPYVTLRRFALACPRVAVGLRSVRGCLFFAPETRLMAAT